MDPRLVRIEEALIAAHNSLALVSGLVSDYVAFQNPGRFGDTETEPKTEQCCAAPDLTAMMGGTSVCNNCGQTTEP